MRTRASGGSSRVIGRVHPVGHQVQGRFTAHLDARSGRWYVYDHILNGVVCIGLASPGAAYAEARRRQREFVRAVERGAD
jgi:hypothetical protein